jgi:hypothetical protein
MPKPQRTELDLWFRDLVGSMDILSDDLARSLLPPNFITTDIGDLHSADRKQKGLE